MPSRLRLKLSTSFFSHTYNQHVKKIGRRNFAREKKNPSFSQCLAIWKKNKSFLNFFWFSWNITDLPSFPWVVMTLKSRCRLQLLSSLHNLKVFCVFFHWFFYEFKQQPGKLKYLDVFFWKALTKSMVNNY